MYLQLVSSQRDPRKQSEQRQRHARDRGIRPLVLCFNTEVGAYFLECNFELPALHEPGADLQQVSPAVGAQQRLRLEFGRRVADEHPTQRYSGHATVTASSRRDWVPDRCASCNFKRAFLVVALVACDSIVIPVNRDFRPGRFGVIQPGLQRWQTSTFAARVDTGLASIRKRVTTVTGLASD